MKYNQLIIGAIVGIVLGCLGTLVGKYYLAPTDQFSVQVMNEDVAIKLNKTTGETWLYNRVVGSWMKLSN